MDQPRHWNAGPDPLDGEEKPTIEGLLREFRRVPLARLAFTALIILWSILFARYSWEAPIGVTTHANDRSSYHFPARPGEPLMLIPIALINFWLRMSSSR